MTPAVPFNPSWKRYEKDLSNPDDQKAREAADKFDIERQHEMRTDPRAKRWEESRKKAIAEQKPAWAKKKQKEKEVQIADALRPLKY
jgi:hypothetical protein